MIIVLIASLPFVFILLFRRVVARLAVRNLRRRPREAALVVLGSLLGTAIMTGSFIVGDTLEASIRHAAHEQLGPADEVISAPGLDAGDDLRARLGGLHDPSIDGVLPLTTAPAIVATPGPHRRAVPRSQLLEVDFAAAHEFGNDPKAAGIEGPTPRSAEAVAGADLMRPLGARVGQVVDVIAYGNTVRLRIVKVLPQRGVAGFWVGFENRSRNLFVAPGTIAQLATAAPGHPPREGFAPPTSLVLVSNRGGVEDGVRQTPAADRAIGAALAGYPANQTDAKRLLLKAAKNAGKNFTQLFTAMGMFGVSAGILLLVNIFVMLAEERKPELGMLRAVGMRRASLVAAFSTEGWLYALASALVGTVVGLGLGRVIVGFAARIFGGGREEFRLTLHFAARARSIQNGFVFGFLIALATVVFTSLRISRFNIIGAIRDLSEPANRRPHRRTAVLGGLAVALGVVWTVSSFANDAPFGELLGPMLALAGSIPLLGGRVLPRRGAISLASIGVLVWGIAGFGSLARVSDNTQLTLFVAEGIALTAGAVALVTQNQHVIGAGVRRVAARSLDLRLGIAYPLARRFRTGMTLAMYSLVVFTIAFITTMANVFSNQLDAFTREIAGGADVIVRSNPANPIPVDALATRSGVRALAPLATLNVNFIQPGDPERKFWEITAFDERWAALGPPKLDRRGPYRSTREAFAAVAADPGLVIVSDRFLQNGGGPPGQRWHPGDRVDILDPASQQRRTVRVAGVMNDDPAFNGALYGFPGARSLFGSRVVANRAYIGLNPGVDPDRFASEVAGAFLVNGAEADSFRSLVANEISQQKQFFQLIRGYLALGLLVGIAGLGVVMVRAVRERRRQIGVLRSLGFVASAVRRTFVIESAFVALEGVAIGTSLALLVAYNLLNSTNFFGSTARFAVPFAALGALVLVTFVASLLATAAPARAASRIRPAVALRIAD